MELLTYIHSSGVWWRIVQRVCDRNEPELTSSHAATFIDGFIARSLYNERMASFIDHDINNKTLSTASSSASASASSAAIMKNNLLVRLISVISSLCRHIVPYRE
jgi:hypothetical protein